MSENKNQHDIISIEDDAKVPDTYGLERFVEEVNILELEGYYFAPSRKAALPRKGPKSLKELYGQPVTISLSEYGQPSELAYKVLQATFRKLTEQGPETDGVVLFSRRELAGLVGKQSFGGTQSDQIFNALMQLRRTSISCAIHFKERVGDKWEKKARVVDFSVFPTVAFEGAPRGRFARCAVQIDDRILRNLKNRYISYFNWERMQGLDMAGMMLYKRLFRHLANIYRDGTNKDELKFEKDYEQVCHLWLGLKPMRYYAEIERQLGKRLEALKRVRLLRECRIEAKADGTGFKLVAYAGSGFFADYENIYHRKLALALPYSSEPEPLIILAEFHRRLGHDQHEFPPKEVAFARELLLRYGEEAVRDLIDFAIAQAKQTKFPMQWLGALNLYEGKWQAQRQQRAKVRERQGAIAACTACNEVGMLEFEDSTVGECPHDASKLAIK
jgi:hypothetical protein